MIVSKEVGIKKVIKIRNGTLVVIYDDKTGLISIDSGDLGDINCDVGGCINANVIGGINGDVLVGINGKVGEEYKIWHDVGDNLEADDDGNIRHGIRHGDVCGNLKGSVIGSLY